MPFPVEAESRTVEAEAMSLGGSIVSQIFGFVRMIAERVIAIVRQIMTWIGEHPMASIMFFVNVLIWFSP